MKKRIFVLLAGAALFLDAFIASGQPAERSGFDLGQVVVTGTKTEHVLGSSPVGVEVITRQDMERRNVQNVQQALDLIPGLKISQDSGSWGDKGKVGIRGLDPKHTLVLLDGQRLRGGHADSPDLQQVSLAMVERIEVVKGPGSALYGSDAVGGVVNIITKSAPDEPTVSVEGMLGGRNTQQYSVVTGLPAGDFGGLASYTYNKSDGVNRETDRYREHILHGSMSYEPTGSFKSSLRPYYSEHSQFDEADRNQRRLGLSSVTEWRPDELSKMTLRGSFFRHQHWTGDKGTDWDDDMYEFEVNYSRLFFDTNTLMVGYEMNHEYRNDRGKENKADQTIHSFFVQNEIDLDPVVLLMGLRVDDHKEWGTQANPRASVMYNVTDDLRLRGSFGTAFRAPNLTRLYADNWRMGPFLVKANPDLKPEESISYEVGAEYNLFDKALAAVSLFRNEVDNLHSSEVTRIGPPSWDLNWINIEKARTQGVEVSLKTRFFDRLAANAGYTFLDTKDKSTGKELIERPNHRFTFDLGYMIPVIEVQSNLEYSYTGSSYGDAENEDKLGGYSIVNLAFTKKFNEHAEVFARIQNLTDKRDVYSEYDLDGTNFQGGVRLRF